MMFESGSGKLWNRHKDNLVMGIVILVGASLVALVIELIHLIEFYMDHGDC